MQSINGEHFDVVIIGAGMSGLAAGIRLALYNKKVIILERHNAAGGLNSFYSIGGRKFDVGLHALTNFVPLGTKNTPLTKLFRQLRIPREAFDLSEQIQSSIVFPSLKLLFNNDFRLLHSQIEEAFPAEIDNFNKLLQAIKETDEVSLSFVETSARKRVGEFIKDPLLVDALFLPLCYYGSAREDDMDWSQFVIMFKSIFLEGFSRPFEGVRQIIRVLLDKYRSLGGLRKMKTGVKALELQNNKVHSILLDSGESITADKIISSAGLVETLHLCNQENTQRAYDSSIGQLSFVETISVLNTQPKALGINDTICFFSTQESFQYKCPSELVDPSSGVICMPNNYQYADGKELTEGFIRTTALANYSQWKKLSEVEYLAQKQYWFTEISKLTQHVLGLPDNGLIQQHIIASDMFTPTTIHKFTGHLNGAVYGATEKIKDGRTPVDNLFICGTDQGFLGIIGALLSGISMANLHVLSAE